MTEYVKTSADGDDWQCPCGNDVMGDGFYPSTSEGVEVEFGSDAWDGKHSVCGKCGRVMDQTTHRPNPDATGEFDSHLVTVTRGPRNLAAVYGKVTGSVSATYTVARRDPATGELVTESEQTWKR